MLADVGDELRSGARARVDAAADDLMAAYTARIFQRRVKFQANVDNVTDEFYADKSLGYANPRTWRLSATTNF